MFDRLSNIFGKDRANGQRAEAPADMMEEQSNNDVNASDNCVQEDASPMSLNIEGSQSMNSQNKRKRAARYRRSKAPSCRYLPHQFNEMRQDLYCSITSASSVNNNVLTDMLPRNLKMKFEKSQSPL